jgi:hypothetical protein
VPALQLSQTPFEQAPEEQVWQARPPAPQAAVLLPGMQVVPAQQPPAHEAPSQTQAPATQCSPLPQGAPLPHWQVPAAEQPSVAMASHAVQLAPGAPQLARLRGLHVPLSQQPSGHEAASQAACATSVSVTVTRAPIWSATVCCAPATTVVPARPSTRRRIDVPPSAAGSRIDAVSSPLVRGRGESGRVPGENATAPPVVVPETTSEVSPSVWS